jgi:hypothetical protein
MAKQRDYVKKIKERLKMVGRPVRHGGEPNLENAKHVECALKISCRRAGWIFCTACTHSIKNRISPFPKNYYDPIKIT